MVSGEAAKVQLNKLTGTEDAEVLVRTSFP